MNAPFFLYSSRFFNAFGKHDPLPKSDKFGWQTLDAKLKMPLTRDKSVGD
jgi:hypothetical protein